MLSNPKAPTPGADVLYQPLPVRPPVGPSVRPPSVSQSVSQSASQLARPTNDSPVWPCVHISIWGSRTPLEGNCKRIFKTASRNKGIWLSFFLFYKGLKKELGCDSESLSMSNLLLLLLAFQPSIQQSLPLLSSLLLRLRIWCSSTLLEKAVQHIRKKTKKVHSVE
jgi:hypothetical protein